MKLTDSLLLCCLSLNSSLGFALGLGDADLKSYLGEPLSVSININDVENLPELSCFSVTDTNESAAFRNPSLTLKSKNSGFLLKISSQNAIDEPVVNLSIAFHCEPNLKREYVLLLDPAPLPNTIAAEKTVSATDMAIPASDNKISAQANSLLSADAQQTAPLKKKKRKSKSSNTPSVEQKLMDAYIGHALASASKAPEIDAKDQRSVQTADSKEVLKKNSSPQLLISGNADNLNLSNQPPRLTLRLEKEINFSRIDADSTSLPADVADEVTVMANRLAHLEKQIVSLQSKNQQLLAEAEKTKSNGQLFSGQFAGWLQNILIGLLVCAALLAGELIRRRITRDRLIKKEAGWFDFGTSAASTEASSIVPIHETKPGDHDPLDESFFDTMNDQGINPANTLLSDNANEGHENILDNAEVFIVHERPELAIQLLQNHLIDYPSESPKIWLKLLSLIAAQGNEADYENVAAECKHFFNIRIPGFADALTQDNSSIEDFPHIIPRLQNIWGSPYATEFLNDLIYNQQSQPREGFSRGTFEELFFLKELAQTVSENISQEQSDLYPVDSIQPNLDNAFFNDTTFQDILNDAADATEFSSATNYEVSMLPDSVNAGYQDAPIQNNAPAEPLEADEIDFFSIKEESPNESAAIDAFEVDTLEESADKKNGETSSKKSANLIEWDLPK